MYKGLGPVEIIPKAQILTLFLLMESAAPSSDWMQADKASCDNPWNTALCREKEKKKKTNKRGVSKA